MRRLVIGLVGAATALVLVAVGADFGGAIYAEYRWSRAVREANGLAFDPWVSILGFPFVTQAARHRFNEVEVRAGAAAHPVVGEASLEATMHGVDLAGTSWLISPDSRLAVGVLESRIIVDSTHVGRFVGMRDLLVEAPARETNDPTGGTTESGISNNRGLVFTGTPRAAGIDEKVSVSVDLDVVGGAGSAGPAGGERTTLVLTATGVLTGPGTADREVPEGKKAAVLAAFSTAVPGMRLPFGIAPTSEGVRGSDVIIEGIATGVTVPLKGFTPS